MLVRKCFGCQLCPLQAIFMGSGMPAVNAISGGWLVYVRAPGAVLGADVSGGGVFGWGPAAGRGGGAGALPPGGEGAPPARRRPPAPPPRRPPPPPPAPQ